MGEGETFHVVCPKASMLSCCLNDASKKNLWMFNFPELSLYTDEINMMKKEGSKDFKRKLQTNVMAYINYYML